MDNPYSRRLDVFISETALGPHWDLIGTSGFSVIQEKRWTCQAFPLPSPMFLQLLILTSFLLLVFEGVEGKQATRSTVIEQLKLRKLFPRQLESNVGSGCYCVGGPLDGQPCPDDCINECPSGEKKRSLSRNRGRSFIDAEFFTGSLLDPVNAALYFLNEGDFTHSNGTAFRDDVYIGITIERRAKAKRAYGINRLITSRTGEKLARFGSRFFGNYVVKLIEDPESVLLLSEDWGVKAKDLLPMAKVLLDRPDWEDFTMFQLSITRNVLKDVVMNLCPGLEGMCNGIDFLD